MASSPVGRQSLYSDSRDYPGCMGGLMHLFDFNQALAGRKMLTDKKFELEQGEATYSDARGSTSEVPKRHAKGSEEVLVVMPRSKYGHELRRPSGSRKSNGMPIRALIAQDLTKELDNKNRSPSVVARLMGLEALPEDFRAPSKRAAGSVSGTADQNFMQRPIFERQSHEESAMHRAKMYTKNSKASNIFSQITPKSSHSSRAGSSHVRNQDSEAPHSISHTQKQHFQEFKKEFEAWQTQKPWNDSKRSSKLEDRQVRVPRHQSPSNQNVNIRDEILYESKEFQDALDFLQSNKEFFMRFLHEPNSLFARHLQENELESPVEATKGIKHRERQSLNSIESPRPPSSTRKSPSSRHLESIDRRDDSRPFSWSHESPLPRSLQVPELIERTASDFRHSAIANSEELSRLSNHRSYPISRMSSQNRAPHPDCQVPTRIVVLKPSPGRVRNINSTTSGYVRSSNDHSSFNAKEDNTDVLERLREKLRKDSSSERKKAEQKSGMLHFNEQYRDSPKDPREIAREIARQVRENITREFMAEPSLLQSGARKKTTGRKQSQPAERQGNASCVGDPQDFTKRVNWDSHRKSSRSSLQPDKIFGFEVMRNTPDQAAEMIEQVKNQVSDSSQVHNFGMKTTSMERNNSHRASQCQLSPGLSNSRWSCEIATEGSFFSQPSEGPMFPNCAVQSKDALNFEFASKPKQNDLVEQSEVALLEALPPPPSEEAKYEPGTQVLEITERVGSEIATLDEAEKSMKHKSNSIDLTTVDANLADHNSLATTEVEQSNAMEEGPDGPQHCDEMRNIARKQQIGGADECPVIDTFGADGTRIEQQLEHVKGNDVDCFNVAQSLEIEQMPITDKNGYAFDSDQVLVPSRNERQVNVAHLDEMPVHSSDISFSTGGLDINVEPVKEQGHDHMPAHSSAISLSTGGLDIDVEPIKEQLEQPSPVSVLDLPDQEDTLAATEYKELSSDLAELRMRLHFLSPDTDNIEGLDLEIDKGSQSENICSIMSDDVDCMQMDYNNCVENAHFNVADWKGENSERCYVRDLLFASGLLGDSSSVLTHWYAPGQPLNPCLYQKLEKACLNGGQEELSQVKSMSKATEGVIVASRRHLLFDCANEVLLHVLGSYVNKHVWSCLKVSPSMPTGKDLMELVWGRASCSLCSHSRSQETLENLVARDLGNHCGWLDIGAQVEARGFDVERAILDDLIEETLLVL